ncbi:MAG: hypothetical protein IJF21_04875, partial [Clostridia bacterium]|nr:hypothetical protein [Clostridia bacterium]
MKEFATLKFECKLIQKVFLAFLLFPFLTTNTALLIYIEQYQCVSNEANGNPGFSWEKLPPQRVMRGHPE